MTIRVTVIGTIFMDCKGFAKQQYNAAGRNLGSVKFVHGGVGRERSREYSQYGIADDVRYQCGQNGYRQRSGEQVGKIRDKPRVHAGDG